MGDELSAVENWATQKARDLTSSELRRLLADLAQIVVVVETMPTAPDGRSVAIEVRETLGLTLD